MNIYDQMNEETKMKIQQQFIQLLGQKDFKKISIQNIASAAQINRGTFYLHYLDKYDLLEQMIIQLLLTLEDHLDQIKPESVLKDMDQSDMNMQSMVLFRYIQQHADFFRILMTQDLPFLFEHQFKNILIRQFEKKIDVFEDIPLNYMSNFASSAYLGIIDEWLKGGMKETPEKLAQYYFGLIKFIREM